MKVFHCSKILFFTLLVVLCSTLLAEADSEEDSETPTDDGYLDFETSDKQEVKESDSSEKNNDNDKDGASLNETSGIDDSEEDVYDEKGVLMTSDHSFKWESILFDKETNYSPPGVVKLVQNVRSAKWYVGYVYIKPLISL